MADGPLRGEDQESRLLSRKESHRRRLASRKTQARRRRQFTFARKAGNMIELPLIGPQQIVRESAYSWKKESQHFWISI